MKAKFKIINIFCFSNWGCIVLFFSTLVGSCVFAQQVIQLPAPTQNYPQVPLQVQSGVQSVPQISPIQQAPTLAEQIVSPPPSTPQPAVVQPLPPVVLPGVVYVSPYYPAPGIGWVWEYHPRYGWGWRHPERGWHKRW
jgi:hypothetical protein